MSRRLLPRAEKRRRRLEQRQQPDEQLRRAGAMVKMAAAGGGGGGGRYYGGGNEGGRAPKRMKTENAGDQHGGGGGGGSGAAGGGGGVRPGLSTPARKGKFLTLKLFIFAGDLCARAAALALLAGWGRGRRWANGGVCARTVACACAQPVAGLEGAEEAAASAGGAVRRRRGLACGGPRHAAGTFFSLSPFIGFFFFFKSVSPCASALLQPDLVSGNWVGGGVGNSAPSKSESRSRLTEVDLLRLQRPARPDYLTSDAVCIVRREGV